jgi:hypothetical protein
MRTIRLALLAALLAILAVACQRYGQNNLPRNNSSPELQHLRDSRQNGLRTRCVTCHGDATARLADERVLDPAGR